MVDKEILVLGFTNAKGKDVKVTLNAPKKDVSPSIISETMDELINIGVISGSDFLPVTKKKNAQFIKTEQTNITLS